MRLEQPFLTDVVRFHSLHLLSEHLLAASDLFDEMIGSSRNVVGPDFIMIDEGCGKIARLMSAVCARITERMQELGSPSDWPVRLMSGHAFDSSEPATFAGDQANVVFTLTLDAFGQSVLEAADLTTSRGDFATADLLGCLWRDIDRQLWRDVRRPATPLQLFISYNRQRVAPHLIAGL